MPEKDHDAPRHGRPGPARALTEEQSAEVRRLRAAGFSWRQITEQIGCSLGAARGAMRVKEKDDA